MRKVSQTLRRLAPERLPFPSGLILALLVFSPVSRADTVRVATWSFQAATTNSPPLKARMQATAAALQKLNPDVIVLERVRDWQMCNALVQALKPDDYTVVVCSAFRADDAGALAKQQVAILSKRKGYFSWSEPWRVEGGPRVSGGIAFTAIQFGKERIGFFATQMDGPTVGLNDSAAVRVALSHQWAQTVGTFRSWVTNRLTAMVVTSGNFRSGSRQEDLALRFFCAPLTQPELVPAGTPPPEDSGALTSVALATDPQSVPAVVLVGARAACELDLAPAKASVPSPALPKVVPASTGAASLNPLPIPTLNAQPSTPSQPPPSPPFNLARLLWLVPAGLLALIWLWARRRRSRLSPVAGLLAANAQTSNGTSYSLVLTQHSGATTFSPAAQLTFPPEAAPGGGPANRRYQVESWPPGPVLLDPKAQPQAAPDRAGLRLSLSHWLKQKLVQRLIADRQQLLTTQQAATVKLLSFEERLALIERQLQQQNQAYEQRIEELSQELLASKEENRELIRARISQVKAEMESARARLMAQVGAGES